MAGRSRIWARKRHQTSDAGGLGSDIAVTPIARARDWALGLMIIASAGALLATSDDHPPDFEFKVSSKIATTALSADKPQAHYLLRAHVTALGPENADSTVGSPNANLTSSIHANPSARAPNASAFVNVNFGTPGDAKDPLSALTTFARGSSLSFTGNCAHPDEAQDDPCLGALELDFELAQPSTLTADGNLIIDWSVDFESRVPKPSGKGLFESVDAPWTIEVLEQ